ASLTETPGLAMSSPGQPMADTVTAAAPAEPIVTAPAEGSAAEADVHFEDGEVDLFSSLEKHLDKESKVKQASEGAQ
ncbi:hypothetical protein LTS18_002029, partial [Coniosporium uncinatum]